MKIRVVKDETPRHDFTLIKREGNKVSSDNYAYAFDMDDNNNFVQNASLNNVADKFYNDCIMYLTNMDGSLDTLLSFLNNDKVPARSIYEEYGYNLINRFNSIVANFNVASKNELEKYVYMIMHNFITDIHNKYNIYIPIDVFKQDILYYIRNAKTGFSMIGPIYKVSKNQDSNFRSIMASEFTKYNFGEIEMLCSKLYYTIYNYLLYNCNINSYSELKRIMDDDINTCIMYVGDAISNVMYNLLCRLSQYDFSKSFEVMKIRSNYIL